MKKYICPICDRVMDKPHYCRNCRQRIKNPVISEVTYKLNEGETLINYCDCDYHVPAANSRPAYDACHDESVRQNQEAYRKGTSSGKPPKKRAVYVPRKAQPGAAAPKASSGLALAIILLMGVLYALYVAVLMIVPGFMSAIQETETTVEVESVYNIENYTDIEVREAGQPCNGYEHFSVDRAVFQEQIIEWTKDNIAPIASEATYSENVSYPDENVSYYDTYTICYFPANENGEKTDWVQIGEDTVDGKVHYVDITMIDEAKWLSTVEKAMELLAAGEELSAEDSGLDEFRLAYVSGQLEEDGSYWESQLFDAYFYRYEDGAPSITIYKMTP